MTGQHIARQRVSNLGLADAPFRSPGDVVKELGAVQSQEYVPALWSLYQRCTGVSPQELVDALADGTILRTHVMRPTWHFVHRDDIRWMIDLTGPRVQAAARHRHRELELDERTIARSMSIILAALEGEHLTRREIAERLEAAGVRTGGQRLPHVLMHAELEGLIASGAMRGRQQTYALLDERAPDSTWLPPEEARAELTARYFRSHGPSTVHDFAWWSGLPVGGIRRAIEMLGSELDSAELDGKRYYFDPSAPTPNGSVGAQLVQEFDEYFVGYTVTRSFTDAAGVLPRGQTLVRAVLFDGQVAGTWRRSTITGEVELTMLRDTDRRAQESIEHAAARCSDFLHAVLPLIGA